MTVGRPDGAFHCRKALECYDRRGGQAGAASQTPFVAPLANGLAGCVVSAGPFGMDVEAWIIAQLKPIVSGPDAWAKVTMDGPSGLVVEAEIAWYEDEDRPGSVSRGVLVEVSLGEPIGCFAYTVSEEGAHMLLDRLEPDEARRIAAGIGSEAAASLTARARP